MSGGGRNQESYPAQCSFAIRSEETQYTNLLLALYAIVCNFLSIGLYVWYNVDIHIISFTFFLGCCPGEWSRRERCFSPSHTSFTNANGRRLLVHFTTFWPIFEGIEVCWNEANNDTDCHSTTKVFTSGLTTPFTWSVA